MNCTLGLSLLVQVATRLIERMLASIKGIDNGQSLSIVADEFGIGKSTIFRAKI